MTLIILIDTLVRRPILVLHATLAVPVPLHPGAGVGATVLPKLGALTMLKVLKPRTVIDRRPLFRLRVLLCVFTKAVA